MIYAAYKSKVVFVQFGMISNYIFRRSFYSFQISKGSKTCLCYNPMEKVLKDQIVLFILITVPYLKLSPGLYLGNSFL